MEQSIFITKFKGTIIIIIIIIITTLQNLQNRSLLFTI